MHLPTIILASASPRRSELLSVAGINFTVRVANIDETPLSGESPDAYVARLAQTKASVVAEPNEVVLGADTTVVIGQEMAGKPADIADAQRMLKMLSGKWHEVLTGVALVSNDQIKSEVAVTRVKFIALSEAEILWYASSGEPDDKAGAYAIQGLASRFIERIEGSYSNVVGLPIEIVYRLLSGSLK